MNHSPENPYAPPTSGSCAGPRLRSPWRTTFAIINLIVATFLSIMCIVSIAAPESPSQFFGAVMFLAPAAIYTVCEWLVLFRNMTSIERGLGIANVALAAFFAFGVAVNVGEFVASDGSSNTSVIFWIAAVGATISAYLLASGYCRVRLKRTTKPPTQSRSSPS